MPKFKSIEEFRQALGSSLKEALGRRTLLTIGKLARELIYTRTKLGYGVTGSGDSVQRQRLKPLSPSYKLARKGYAQGGAMFNATDRNGKRKLVQFKTAGSKPTGFGFSVNKSNLTLTGQMLENIVVKVQEASVVLSIASTSRPDSELNNREVAEQVSKERPFFDLTESERTRIVNEVTRIIRAETRRF